MRGSKAALGFPLLRELAARLSHEDDAGAAHGDRREQKRGRHGLLYFETGGGAKIIQAALGRFG